MIRTLGLTAACFSFLGCAESLERVPAESVASWSIATPEEMDLDGERLRAALKGLPEGHGLRSFLVVRHGKLVSETYWNGADADTLQDLRSATKSITSLLVGMAIADGKLAGVDASIGEHLEVPETLRSITVGDLLTMRSGLACDDRDASSPGNEEKMYGQRDWVSFFLALPVRAEHGTVTNYCTGGVVALGRIVEAATQTRIEGYSRDRLFRPLGIEHWRWATFDEGRGTDSGGHLRLRPRDFARIGQLALSHGRWEGQQVVPSEWIDDSFREHTRIDAAQVAYGHLWWLQDAESNRVIFASGNGGQLLFIVPSLDVVAVSTGSNYDSEKQAIPFQLFTFGVLQAVLR